MTTYINATGITVDGVPLNTLAKSPETKSGRLTVAAARGSNPPVSGRSGSIWTPNKPSEEGSFFLPLWVLGCDDDGAIPGGSSALREFYKNKELLQRLFSKRYGLLDVQATQPDGTVRQAMCEVIALLDYQMFNEHDARVGVEFRIPSTYWQDAATADYAYPGVTASPYVATPAALAAATAPMEDAEYLVHVTAGTLTNPRLTDPLTGVYVQYNGVLQSGSTDWYVNASNWTSKTSPGYGFSNTGTNQISHTDHGGSSRLLTMTPRSYDGQVRLQLSGTYASGGSADLTIRARRKYHS